MLCRMSWTFSVSWAEWLAGSCATRGGSNAWAYEAFVSCLGHSLSCGDHPVITLTACVVGGVHGVLYCVLVVDSMLLSCALLQSVLSTVHYQTSVRPLCCRTVCACVLTSCIPEKGHLMSLYHCTLQIHTLAGPVLHISFSLLQAVSHPVI